MKRNLRAPFVLMAGLIVMFLLLGGSGCKGSVSNPTATETPPTDTSPTTNTSPPTTSPTTTSPTSTPSAQINVSSRQIAIGNVVLNNISVQTVSIQNTGSASLTIGQIAQANPLASPFSIVSDNCSGKAVQPSATCSFSVQFSPASQGPFSDSFDIPSDAANENSVTVDVTGSGKALRTVINQVKTGSCPTLEFIVTVTDPNNNLLTGLTSTAFQQLTENGVSQQITSVSEILAPLPVSVALTLDYSGTMESSLPTLEAATTDFIGLLNPADEAAIIKFGASAQLMQDFTSSQPDLITAITATPTQIGSGATFLYDSIWFSLEKTATRSKIKAVVVLSDGRDENSQGVQDVSIKTPDEVIAYAKANAVEIYTVGLGNVDAAVMGRLASETGGQFYPITSADQLSGVYDAIRNILSGKYAVQYVTSLHGSTPITLGIDVLSGADEGVAVGEFAGCP